MTSCQSILTFLKKAFKKAVTIIGRSYFYKKRRIINVGDYKMLIAEDVDWAYASGDYYECNVIHFLDILLKSYESPTMIDAGANCGYYTLRYSNTCKQIFSFEPVSSTYKILKRNIKRNSIRNVRTFRMGLSDKNEQKAINLYNSSGNNSLFERTVPENHPLKKVGSEIIKLKTLDELIDCQAVTKPDFIKVDVEGSELNFLNGAKRTIEQGRPAILIEYSENTSADGGYSREQLISTLKLVNYTIYGIPENEKDLTLIKAENIGDHRVANLLFLPKESDPMAFIAAS